MNVRSDGRTGLWAASGSSCFWSQRAFALLLYVLLTSKMWHVHAGIVLCFQVFGLAQFQGERLTALTVLLGLFGLASLPLTYFLHFFFTVSQQACFWVLFWGKCSAYIACIIVLVCMCCLATVHAKAQFNLVILA